MLSSIKLESCKMSRIATHSKTDPLEMLKKLRLSGFENLPEPSALLRAMLKEARDYLYFFVLSGLIDLINCFDSKCKAFAFL